MAISYPAHKQPITNERGKTMKYSNDSLMAHAYGRKRTSLSAEVRIQGLKILELIEEERRSKGSTDCKYGISAYSIDGLIRDLTNLRGVDYRVSDESGHKVIDILCRPNRNNRGECILYGRPGEIKSGGCVNYNPPTDWDECDILPNKEYIAWTLLEEASEAEDPINGICDWTAIMSREEFIELCERASRKGIHGTFHVTTRGPLAFQPTPLRKLREMIKQMIEDGEIETLEGYLLDRAEQ